MAKFRFYLIDEDGQVSGTNDEDVAQAFGSSDVQTAIDSERGAFICDDVEGDVPEITVQGQEDDEGEEEQEEDGPVSDKESPAG